MFLNESKIHNLYTFLEAVVANPVLLSALLLKACFMLPLPVPEECLTGYELPRSVYVSFRENLPSHDA